MNPEFKQQGNWILPTEGTLGNKAKNLLDNTPVIEAQDLKVPKSLVIPYEYYDREGYIYYILDWINDNFKDCPKIAVRSNSPDEDIEKRNPGLYTSVVTSHLDRREAINDIERVLASYHNSDAAARRKRLGLEEKDMCLLVQEFIDASWAGCFSDIGELAVLTLNDPRHGIDAMQKPSFKKYRVDSEGTIKGPREYSTYEAHLAERLRKLADDLPKIEDKGWEIEFVGNKNGLYVVQTTPIEKKEPFEVKETEDNVFEYLKVIGTGELFAEGILFVPSFTRTEIDEVTEFDKTHSNYCLATSHECITTAKSRIEIGGSLLNYTPNASIILDISTHGGLYSFAAHVEQYLREGKIALLGTFNNELENTMPNNDIPLPIISLVTMLYSPTKLAVQADEVEQKANIEVVGEIQPFIPLDEYLEGGEIKCQTY